MLMCGLLFAFGLLCGFRVAYIVGWILIALCLAMEHWIARRRSLNWINTAFFRLNAVVSLIFLVITVAEVVFRSGFKLRE
jgi:4-hydroxybenzoate polyprenyltransferase